MDPPNKEGVHPARLLVVDDAMSSRLIVKRILERLGYDVTLASTGDEAVALATAGPFDAIIMDVEMSGMDGLTATRLIREHDSRVPILAFTGNDKLEDARTCRRAGMTGMLRKPADPRQFEQMIAVVVAARRSG